MLYRARMVVSIAQGLPAPLPKYFAPNSHFGAVALSGGVTVVWETKQNKLDRYKSLTTMRARMQSINLVYSAHVIQR